MKLDPSTVTHTFARVLRQAGLPHIRFHDLRHTHATLLFMAGVHPKVVSERLGHSSVAFTMDTYSHVLPTMQETAAERFDRLIPPGLINEDNTGGNAGLRHAQGVAKMLPNVAKCCQIGFSRGGF